MALPDTGMSAVIALHASLFQKRAEIVFKNQSSALCIPEIRIELDPENPDGAELTIFDIVIRPDDLRFRRREDRSLVAYNLSISLRLFGSTHQFTAELLMALDGQITGNEQRTITLELSFEELRLIDPQPIPPEFHGEVEAIVQGKLEAFLADFSASMPLDAVLPDGAELEPDVLFNVISWNETSSIGYTLLIGVSCDLDTGVDTDLFDAFDEDLLSDTPNDWMMQIDSELLRRRVLTTLAQVDVREQDELGNENPNGIDNWTATTSVRALWSGDPINIQVHGQSEYILEHYDEHPIWFVFEGTYDTGQSISLNAYAVGYADFAVNEEEGALEAIPHIIAAGWGFINLPVEQPEPQWLTSTTIADNLRIDSLDFDADRLTVKGIDDHEGLAGYPLLFWPDSLDIIYSPPHETGSPCHAAQATGELLEDAVIKRPGFRNDGGAPLFVCGLSMVDDPDGLFHLTTTDNEPLHFPVRIDPGQLWQYMIHYNAPDYETHSATVQVITSDYDHTRIPIPVTARRDPDPEFIEVSDPLGILCLREPDLVPAEWLDWATNILVHINDFTTDPPPDNVYAEITLGGLSPSTVIQVFDEARRPAAYSMAVGSMQALSVPLGDAAAFEYDRSMRSRKARMRIRFSRPEKVFPIPQKAPFLGHSLDRGLLYAHFEDGIYLYGLDELHTRRGAHPISHIPVEEGVNMHVRNRILTVQSRRNLKIYRCDDPYRPGWMKDIELPENAGSALWQDRLFLFFKDHVRVYRFRREKELEWIGDVPTALQYEAILPWRNQVAFLGSKGGMIVPGVSSDELRAGKPLATDALPAPLRPLTHADARSTIHWPHHEVLIQKDGAGELAIFKKHPFRMKFDKQALRESLEKWIKGDVSLL